MGWILYHYQTLFAGAFAIVAAVVTVWGMWIISNSERRRRLSACRAMMPADLSAISRYARESARTTIEILQRIKKGDHTGPAPAITDIPPHVFDRLQTTVEQLDRRDVSAVCELLGSYQIHRSRFATAVEGYNDPDSVGGIFLDDAADDLEIALLENVRLQLITNKLFDFARRRTKHIPPLVFTEDNLENAKRRLGIAANVSPDVQLSLNELIENN